MRGADDRRIVQCFRQTLGMDPGSNFFTFRVEQPLKAILVKMFRTNHEPAFRIELFSV